MGRSANTHVVAGARRRIAATTRASSGRRGAAMRPTLMASLAPCQIAKPTSRTVSARRARPRLMPRQRVAVSRTIAPPTPPEA